MDDEKRLDFNSIFYRIGWGIVSAAAIFVMSKINSLTDSIATLNTSIAVMVEQSTTNRKVTDDNSVTIRDHEKRLNRLEWFHRND